MPDILITPSSGNIRFSQLTTDNSANISLSGNNLIVSSLGRFMNYEIVEIIMDLSGKYRARIIIDDQTQETMFFKFDNYPSQEEVNEVVSQYKNQLNDLNI